MDDFLVTFSLKSSKHSNVIQKFMYNTAWKLYFNAFESDESS